MIPTVFVPLKQMPLTSSGKTDRHKLRQLVSGLSKEQLASCSLGEGVKRPPSTEMEKRLQQVWSRVLNIQADNIGAGDSFFRLGGDSIIAMRMVAAARAAGICVTVADVFSHPILSDLSLVATSIGAVAAEVEVPPYSLLGDAETVERHLPRCAAPVCHLRGFGGGYLPMHTPSGRPHGAFDQTPRDVRGRESWWTCRRIWTWTGFVPRGRRQLSRLQSSVPGLCRPQLVDLCRWC